MGLNKHVCSFCGNEYENYFKESKYCSQDCYKEYRKLNAKLKGRVCRNCGERFDAHDHNVIYCSRKCAGESRQNRVECVCDNCGEQFDRPRYMAERHNGNFCSKECFAEATFWSKEDEQILLDNYGKIPPEKIASLLSRDIKPHSIGRKADAMGLRNKRYATYQNEPYKELCRYVRRRLNKWVSSIKNNNDYTCAITGEKSNVVVHHIRGFNLIMEECIELLNFNINKNFEEHSQNELDNFVDKFFEIQEYYGDYICISESIHEQFHRQYGKGNNTREQWNEFIEYYNNSNIA